LLPTNYNHLIEPFVGGGSVFLSVEPDKLIINDLNQELMTTYRVIKDTPKPLISLLQEYEKKHSSEFYEQLKQKEPKDLTHLEIATRFIYLNKTGYNGLYRVNGKGEFNVPFGQKEKIKLFERNNILATSDYLYTTDCQILNQDYQELLSLIKEGDFLFVDPPYDSENGNSFNSYTTNKFTRENQQELAQFLKKVEKKGAN
jgi:DNA adenine methylase